MWLVLTSLFIDCKNRPSNDDTRFFAQSLKQLFTKDIIILFSCLIQHINEFTGLMGIKGFLVHLNKMNYLSGLTQGQFLCNARSKIIISHYTMHLLWYQPFLSPLTVFNFLKIIFLLRTLKMGSLIRQRKGTIL